MRPKKKIIERAIKNGTIERLNQLLSGMHLLVCTANSYFQESADLLHDNGMMLGELKKSFSNYLYASDVYFREFAAMINGEESKMDMFSDMEEFDKAFREWAKIEKDWKPKTIDQS